MRRNENEMPAIKSNVNKEVSSDLIFTFVRVITVMVLVLTFARSLRELRIYK